MTITLYYLDNSRAFRVLWTAYELGVGERVHVKKFPRVQGKKAVPEMTSESGFSLGKSPFLVDDEGGDRVEVFESVACMEYLMERYGSASIELLPPMGKWAERTKVASYLSFCETLMLHSLAIIYAQWFTPAGNDEVLRPLTDTMSGIVCKDLDLLERTLEENKSAFGAENGLYLANGRFSAADIANAFSAEYILTKGVGTNGKKWPNVEAWLKKIEQRPAYQATKKAAGLHDFTLLEQ